MLVKGATGSLLSTDINRPLPGTLCMQIASMTAMYSGAVTNCMSVAYMVACVSEAGKAGTTNFVP